MSGQVSKESDWIISYSFKHHDVLQVILQSIFRWWKLDLRRAASKILTRGKNDSRVRNGDVKVLGFRLVLLADFMAFSQWITRRNGFSLSRHEML